MSTPERNRSGAFQIEVGTMEGFLELLGSREEEGVPSVNDTLPRRAVFVAPLKHARLSEGIPLITRRVRAAFAYGGDLVTLTRVTANGYEFPSPTDDAWKNNARQEEVLEKTRREIREGQTALGLSVPVRVGWLGHAGVDGIGKDGG